MENKDTSKVIIIGGGPAGVTSAYELAKNSDIKPIIIESENVIGGISKTIEHNGYKLDLGPHRFFSKSDRVMKCWLDVLPLQGAYAKDDKVLNRDIPLSDLPDAPDPEKEDKVMLYKNRMTRIFFLRKLFEYPITLNKTTILNLGIARIFKIGMSYMSIRLFPIRKEVTLEDFFINRFGKELYKTFFEDYTEKVWGVPCTEIPKDWGAQRIKGLSISKALGHAVKNMLKKSGNDQKKTETSLIERFMYPKLGAGQVYEEIANQAVKNGGEIILNHKVTGVITDDKKITGVKVIDNKTKEEKIIQGDYFFSTMPIRELISSFDKGVPKEIKELSDGLVYRDYLTVGLLVDKMILKNESSVKTINNIIPDNWIYVQERDVKIGRLDFFNNFSPYMLKDENMIWLGAEYFCNEGDEIWSMEDKDLVNFVGDELEKIDILKKEDIKDSVVVRVPKAYPAYFGTYNRFEEIKDFLNQYENLSLIGRNGMHKYNNMDHSMLTAMVAADNVINGVKTKENLWNINTEDDYHEEKDSQ